MIGIFRRLGAMPALPALPAAPEPDGYWTEPAPPVAPGLDVAMDEILHLRQQLAKAEQHRDQAQREAAAAVRRARDAECDLQAVTARLALTSGDGAAAELARMRRTLTALEDLLAGCRRDHGSNIRASALRTGTADTDAPYDEIAAIKRREDV